MLLLEVKSCPLSDGGKKPPAAALCFRPGPSFPQNAPHPFPIALPGFQPRSSCSVLVPWAPEAGSTSGVQGHGGETGRPRSDDLAHSSSCVARNLEP